MRRKSIIVMAALVVGLALGFVLGPVARSSVASAQTEPPTPGQSTTRADLKSLFLDQLAAALNVQRATLDSAIVTAGSTTADAAVQQGTLTQAQADALKVRIQTDGLDALVGGHGGPKGGARMGGGIMQVMLNAAASTLNLTQAEIMTQLRSGQTLAQIAQAQGTTEQAVTDAALAAAKTQLDQAVSSGTMTQAQADTIYARVQQQVTQLFTPRGRGGDGQRGPGAPAAPQTPATPQTQSATPNV